MERGSEALYSRFLLTHRKISSSLCPAMVHLFKTWGKSIPLAAHDKTEDFLQKEPYTSIFRGFETFWISISTSITWPCQCEVLGGPSSDGTFCCGALRNYHSNEYGVKLKYSSCLWKGSLFVKGGPGTANSYPRHCSRYSDEDRITALPDLLLSKSSACCRSDTQSELGFCTKTGKTCGNNDSTIQQHSNLDHSTGV